MPNDVVYDDPNDPIIGGVVVDKRHRASYTTITFPVINRYPERWFLTVLKLSMSRAERRQNNSVCPGKIGKE